MPFIEEQKGWYRIVVKYQGKKFQKALGTDSEKKAKELLGRVEENLRLLRRGRIPYAPGDDLITLLLSDGKLKHEPVVEKPVTLGEFFDRFQANRPPGKEGNTAYTEDIHIAHLRRILGERTALAIVPDRLQTYVTDRSREKSKRGDFISQVTIKKELGTLTSIWNRWGMREKIVNAPLSVRDLDYAKSREKPPFQSFAQVQKRVEQGAPQELWDCVYLNLDELNPLLDHAKTSKFPWVYPMFCFCALTGARRSEMLRSRREDLDFEAGTVTIREKKKDRSKIETYRHVPMAPRLREALAEWLAVHPGGPMTFCERETDKEMTPQMANHYFRWTVDPSKWKVLKGWHVLRHSFISSMASKGIDQRIIMQLVGHLNHETHRRYMHLWPSTSVDAMKLVFGG